MVSIAVSVFRRIHESLKFEIAVPDTGERLNVPLFGGPDVDRAVLAPDGSVVSA
jgi:hypothetical protein